MSEDNSASNSDCDIDEREKLIKQVNNYHNNFPEILSKKVEKKPNAKKYSNVTPIETIKKDLEDAQTAVASQNFVKDMGALAVSASYGLQNMASMVGLKLSGPKVDLATIVHQNKDSFNILIKEIACKYDLMGLAQPEVRLAMLTSQCILIVHSTNAREEKPVENEHTILKPDSEIKSE
jgi:hypothetical protein